MSQFVSKSFVQYMDKYMYIAAAVVVVGDGVWLLIVDRHNNHLESFHRYVENRVNSVDKQFDGNGSLDYNQYVSNMLEEQLDKMFLVLNYVVDRVGGYEYDVAVVA